MVWAGGIDSHKSHYGHIGLLTLNIFFIDHVILCAIKTAR